MDDSLAPGGEAGGGGRPPDVRGGEPGGAGLSPLLLHNERESIFYIVFRFFNTHFPYHTEILEYWANSFPCTSFPCISYCV